MLFLIMSGNTSRDIQQPIIYCMGGNYEENCIKEIEEQKRLLSQKV